MSSSNYRKDHRSAHQALRGAYRRLIDIADEIAIGQLIEQRLPPDEPAADQSYEEFLHAVGIDLSEQAELSALAGVRPLQQVAEDFLSLPTPASKDRALRVFELLNRNPLTGGLLDYRLSQAVPAGCRKLYFDQSPNRLAGWYIVYRLVPHGENPDLVQVVAIGQRNDARVAVDLALG